MHPILTPPCSLKCSMHGDEELAPAPRFWHISHTHIFSPPSCSDNYTCYNALRPREITTQPSTLVGRRSLRDSSWFSQRFRLFQRFRHAGPFGYCRMRKPQHSVFVSPVPSLPTAVTSIRGRRRALRLGHRMMALCRID